MYICVYAYTISELYTLELAMRTNIEIDDKLMNDVLKATGAPTKKAVVELGLKTLIRLKKQENIKAFRAQLQWTGDLDDMRSAS